MDLFEKVKGHCAGASIKHYFRTEQMQNLDWNKCFQRVSDAGLHFPLLFPVAGWHLFVFLFSPDHPGRLDENGYRLCLGGSMRSSRARSKARQSRESSLMRCRSKQKYITKYYCLLDVWIFSQVIYSVVISDFSLVRKK